MPPPTHPASACAAALPPTPPPTWPDASPIDLHVSTSARALMTTRNARTSGRHLHNFPPHSKHIAFVIDS
eukprot:3347346-Pleurochrysis_carterae.AAC.1